MIPNRNEVQTRINLIRNALSFSTLKQEVYEKISAWLDGLECPAEDKEKILSDLSSYQGY